MTQSEAKPKRVFFYVQHLLGIGHLVRASRIAHAMAKAGLDVTVVTGGSIIEGFPGKACAMCSFLLSLRQTAAFPALLMHR